jgi:hypothetical protein
MDVCNRSQFICTANSIFMRISEKFVGEIGRFSAICFCIRQHFSLETEGVAALAMLAARARPATSISPCG